MRKGIFLRKGGKIENLFSEEQERWERTSEMVRENRIRERKERS
jgi:hypothetical protein